MSDYATLIRPTALAKRSVGGRLAYEMNPPGPPYQGG